MAANNSLVLSSLDFNALKQNFKNFLAANSTFKDYNFEGSNINVLLDVMAYNSYLNSFYLNMVTSEMFLDSSQKLNSVISHAKELNYLPRSAKCSSAEINFTIETTGVTSPLSIPAGTRFNGTNSNGTFTFVTDEEQLYSSSNGTYVVTGLPVYEGKPITEAYIKNDSLSGQRFVLNNEFVDTDTISVVVTENGTETIFTKANNLFGLTDQSEIYFVQPYSDGQYEIVFGDGVMGKSPIHLSLISISYRTTNGSLADGISSFTALEDIAGLNSGAGTTSEILATESSSGGNDPETIESIKFNAPRHFATQDRAVSNDDYASLILSNFSGEIDDVIVYGGETLETKLYGRVIVSLKPSGGTVTPEYLKSKIDMFLADYISIPTRVVMVDPDYFYCGITSKIQYDTIAGSLTVEAVKSLALNDIVEFSTTALEKFGNDLRYSRLITTIDNVDAHITSNDTKLTLIKRITPVLNTTTSYSIEYNNKFATSFVGQECLTSSSFTYTNAAGTDYLLCKIKDDALGNLVVYNASGTIATIGTIDYTNGKIVFSIKTSSYSNHISLIATPFNKDVLANKNMVLVIDSEDISLEISETLR